MKFTKEQLSEALKAKLTPNGKKLAMSERTLTKNVERLYNRLAKDEANEELELDDVVTEYLPDFEEINDNVRKDKSDFANDFEADWKKKHPEADPAPEGNGGKGGKKGDGNAGDDDRLDKILKELEAMKAREQARTDAEAATGKRNDLLAKFKEKGIDDEKWIAMYMKKLNVTKDTDVDAEVEDALTFFNAFSSSADPNATPERTGGKGGNDYSEAFEAIRKEREARLKIERGEQPK